MTDRFAPVPLAQIPAGAIPDPLLVPVQDANGDPRNIAGFTVKGTIWRTGSGSPVERTGTVVDSAATNDAMQLPFTPGEFDTPGTYRMILWAVNPGNTIRIPSPVYELQVVTTGMTPPTA